MTKVGDVVTVCSEKNGSDQISECNALVIGVWSNSVSRYINCISVRLVAEVSLGGQPVTMGREETWTKVPHATRRRCGAHGEDHCWWI